ncbi:Wzz/FepE/Etk N-terminal domain-containing protein [uncultured Agathobaculum sp.]|uniref:YveK family protein n=1 Tax=uncultured Agathobaculum sp. TaxID=2048140 RepID=UPI00296EB481
MVKERDNEEVEIDLLALARALWRRAWAVILAMLIGGAAMFSYASFLITPLYQAKALMYVNSSSLSVGNTKLSISQAELSAAQSLVDTYIVILNSRTTLNDVIKEAEVPYTYEQLSSMISAQAVNSTEVFEVVVTDANPQEAEKIANAIADVLPNKIAAIVEGSSARIVDYAVVPSQKSSPNITKLTAMGLLAGFVLSAAVIIVLELMDETIHDEDYLAQNFDLPVLAAIPDMLNSGKDKGYYKYGSYGAYEQEAEK